MLTHAISRPYGRVENAINLAASMSGLSDYIPLHLNYGFDSSRRLISFGLDDLTDIMEGVINEQLDEFTNNDTNWKATDRDIRGGQKPYDDEEEEEVKKPDYVPPTLPDIGFSGQFTPETDSEELQLDEHRA
jgi:hypothetical protein